MRESAGVSCAGGHHLERVRDEGVGERDGRGDQGRVLATQSLKVGLRWTDCRRVGADVPRGFPSGGQVFVGSPALLGVVGVVWGVGGNLGVL